PEEGAVETDWFGACQNQQAGYPLDEVARRSRETARPALNQQRARQQERFSLPKQCDLVQICAWRRKVLHADGVQLPSKVFRRQAGGIFVALRVVATKVEYGRILRIGFKEPD